MRIQAFSHHPAGMQAGLMFDLLQGHDAGEELATRRGLALGCRVPKVIPIFFTCRVRVIVPLLEFLSEIRCDNRSSPYPAACIICTKLFPSAA